MKYSFDQLREIQALAKQMKLNAPKEFFLASAEELQKICNGVGAEWLSNASRNIMTKAFKCVEVTAAIHDFVYHYSDGTNEAQEKADEDFLINGTKENLYYYPSFFSIKRILNERKVIAAYNVLKRVGRLAWRDAYVERKINENEIK